ncbi:MAG TPA: hypothetical protein PK205_13280 [Promineifilum sp.]|nr:hypothetical protein [Promineifilum sp.]HRO89250.1 hypothetical protein [Promineifilum sp.]HRQ14272.1 hypothetical protein [Promineifilum sp.]
MTPYELVYSMMTPFLPVLYGKVRRDVRSFSPRRPLTTAKAMAGNLINRWESRGLDEQPSRTAHLFAIARKEK